MKYDAIHHLVLRLNTNGGLNANTVIQSMPLKNNKVMLLPVESGPAIIDVIHNTIQTIKGNDKINSRVTKMMLNDSHGRIWVGGNQNNWGIYSIDPDMKTMSYFNTKEGLTNSNIVSLLEYQGKIIAGTYEKINIITPPEIAADHKWHIGTMSHTENLKKEYISFVSDAITKRGNFLYGDAGLTIIHGITEDTTKGNDIISGITVMGNTLRFTDSSAVQITDSSGKKFDKKMSSFGFTTQGAIRWDSLSGPCHLPVNLSLPYDKNTVRFQFTEISGGRPDNVQYAYMLEGIDKKWTFTTDTRTESYLNLSPGDYIFKVASKWKNGKWNTPAVFSFKIRPPWYQNWWAYLAYLIVAASLLRLYIVFRSRQLMRENKLLEEKVNQRTEELRQSYNNVEKLEEIGKKITSSLSVEKIISTVYDNVNSLMDANIFGIGIYNDELKRIEFPATYEEGKQLTSYFNSIEDKNRFASACFNNNKEIIIGDLGTEYQKYIQNIQTPREGEQPRSLIFLPLVAKEKKLGVITVQSFKQNAYTDYHLYMLRNIAIYAAIALENAQSYEDLKSTQAQLIQSEKMA
jgi:hypothetical protein